MNSEKNTPRILKAAFLIIFVAIILIFTLSSAVPVTPFDPSPNTTTALPGQGPTDPIELEAFLDAFFTEKMEEMHIPGLAFVMVKDGEISLMKGYGYADIEMQIPVDPVRTLFRAGSVSKLFTWTAAMQMLEKGLLELDTDVNQYLTAFQIPDTYAAPVTLRHLMTHTAGFEDRWIGWKTFDEDKVLQLGQFMESNIPDRVTEPGSIHSYSNYSGSLTGYLVEQVSGTSFSEYVDKNIFQPLGMVRSTFQQPVPETLASDLAVGYKYIDGNYEAEPFIYTHAVPEGGISTTVADMAAFMIAHLQDGLYQNTRILEEATAKQMHQQLFTHSPELPGMTYGFKERYINGQRVISHGGDIHTFSAQMILLPEQNEGFFLLYNRFSDSLREDLISAYFSQYYPAQQEATVPEALSMTQEDLSRFVGSYRWVKYPRSTLGKMIAFMPGPYNIRIESNDDGSLSMSFFGANVEWRYVPVEPLVFKQISGGPQAIGDLKVDPGDTLVFREDGDNRITYGFVTLQNTAFEKLSWYETPTIMMGGLAVLIVMFLLPLILWPIGSLVQRLRKRTSSVTIASRRARWLAGIVCGLNLIFIIGLFLTIGENLVFGMSPIILVLLAVFILSSLLTLILLVFLVLVWKNRYWSVLSRVHYSLIVIAGVVCILWSNYWNLLGFRF